MQTDSLSSSELANLRLPNLQVSRQAIEKRAKTQGWPYIEEVGKARGGRLKKYLIASLPPEIRNAIQQKQAESLLAESENLVEALPAAVGKAPAKRANTQLGLPIDEAVGGLTEKQRQCAHARMSIVAEVLKMHRIGGLKISYAQAYVLEQLEQGRLPQYLMDLLPLANARSGGEVKLSMRSLKEWTIAYRKAATPNERLMALAPKLTRKAVPLSEYRWLPHFIRFHNVPSAPKLAHSYGLFADWWEKHMPINEMPTESQVRRVWEKLPMIMQERGRRTGAAYKALMPYVKRDWGALKPNDVWIGDGHSFKAKVAHPVHGRPFKPEVTVILDGCTRMVMGFSVSLAESCVAVCDALRIGVKHFGVPLMYYSDNGGGQTGKTIDHEITGIAARLGIHHETGLPGNPQGRGIIERWWKDNLIRMARQYETFTGEGMDSSTKNLTYRKLESAFNALEQGKELTAEQRKWAAKLPSWKQFIADVLVCIEEYNNRPHRELPKTADGSHYTPKQYRDARMISDGLTPDFFAAEEEETLFRPQEIRKVQRGWLDLFGNQYFSVDLAEYHKDEVRVAYDLDDAQGVLVYDMEGKFLCKAKLNGNKHAAFPTTRLEQLAEQRRKGRVKRAENIIKQANAEANPALEQAATWDELGNLGREELVIEAEYAVSTKTGTDDFELFEADM